MSIQTEDSFDLLAVDRDRSQYELIAQALEEAGYRFRHACDAQEALHMHVISPARVWLANLSLTDSSGIELLKVVRARRPTAAFYLVSDVYSVADELAARASGATGYLSKPVDQIWVDLCLAALCRCTVRAGPKGSSKKHPITRPINLVKPLTQTNQLKETR